MTLGQLQNKVDDAIRRLGTGAPVRVIADTQAPADSTTFLSSAQGLEYNDGRRAFLLITREDTQ